MSAIWHDNGQPSFICAAPQFSFADIAEIIQPAPTPYEEARQDMIRWERKMGAAWFQNNTQLAHQFWERKKPWWLSL